MSNMFQIRENAINQLKQDKHTLLEGYVTEHLFEEQFLENSKVMYTTGWWMATANNRKYFFVVKEVLNALDYELIHKIKSNAICWHVFIEDSKWVFNNESDSLEETEFTNMYGLNEIRKVMTATKETRDSNRQFKCINYFDKNGLLEKVAIERFFANNFLTKYFKGMVNVDCFTKTHENTFNVIEIKFKFESKDGYFGINLGQMNMFKYFELQGFKINHFILYNHTKDLDLSIFGFIKLQEEKFWWFKVLKNICNTQIGVAPEKTSVSGGFKQSYYKIKSTDFKQKIKLNV